MMFGVGIAIALIAVAAVGLVNVTASNLKPGFYHNPEGECSSNDLALCLSDNGAKLYGAFWCPHCADQKNLFGDSAKFLPYIECDIGEPGKTSVQNPTCENVGITGFPTWIMADGTRLEGVQPLSKLGEISGCFEYA